MPLSLIHEYECEQNQAHKLVRRQIHYPLHLVATVDFFEPEHPDLTWEPPAVDDYPVHESVNCGAPVDQLEQSEEEKHGQGGPRQGLA